jgi:hypothetical protein
MSAGLLTGDGQEVSLRFKTRLAGCLYLLIILGGLFAPFAIAPSGMMLGEAAQPTAAAIMAAKPLFVLGGVIQPLVYCCDVGVALIFYDLLRPVHRDLALAAACFRLLFVAIASANMVNHFAPLILLSGADALSTFSPGQLYALALLFIRLRTYGFDIALIFFGIHWLFTGYLFFKSPLAPNILGLALAFGGVGYLSNIFAATLPSGIRSFLFPYILLPAGIAEASLTLWLIFARVNVSKWEQLANRSY